MSGRVIHFVLFQWTLIGSVSLWFAKKWRYKSFSWPTASPLLDFLRFLPGGIHYSCTCAIKTSHKFSTHLSHLFFFVSLLLSIVELNLSFICMYFSKNGIQRHGGSPCFYDSSPAAMGSQDSHLVWNLLTVIMAAEPSDPRSFTLTNIGGAYY